MYAYNDGAVLGISDPQDIFARKMSTSSSGVRSQRLGGSNLPRPSSFGFFVHDLIIWGAQRSVVA